MLRGEFWHGGHPVPPEYPRNRLTEALAMYIIVIATHVIKDMEFIQIMKNINLYHNTTPNILSRV